MADSLYLDFGKSIKALSRSWYKIVQRLGVGGNAVTYLVIQTEGPFKGLLFALKIFRRLSSPERKGKFLEEVTFLMECNHPSVMRVFDTGIFVDDDDKEHPFVVAEYLPRTLHDVIRGRAIRTVEKVSFSIQLLSAISFIENLNPPVVHRDIKPKNIFVKGKSCVLGDFGLMKKLVDIGEEDRNFFRESAEPGMAFFYRTPDLISYVRGETGLTSKTDVFQLGLVLTELFTGWNPCKRPQNDDYLADIELENIGDIPGSSGGSIASLLKRMLVLSPEERELATQLMDGWMGLFHDVSNKSHELDGIVM